MSPASPDSDSDQPTRRSGATSLAQNRPLHVSIVALPESMMSPVGGIHEVLGALHHFSAYDAALPREARFRPEIVAVEGGQRSLTSEVPITFDHPNTRFCPMFVMSLAKFPFAIGSSSAGGSSLWVFI